MIRRRELSAEEKRALSGRPPAKPRAARPPLTRRRRRRKRYYVYIIHDDRCRAIYVGKGSGDRFLSHMKRPELRGAKQLLVQVLFCDSEREALAEEARLVSWFGVDNLLNKVAPRSL